MAKDDILFLYIQFNDVTCILFVCDTYLYLEPNAFYGKLMYSNKKVHEEYTVPGKKFKQILFNCAYRYTKENMLRPLTDEELQKVGKSLGLALGSGLDKHLCGAPENSKVVFLTSPFFHENYPSEEAQFLANEIGRMYMVDPYDLRITGGLHLFPSNISESHDVDIVISIDSHDQLKNILNDTNSIRIKPVREFGYIWPLRWLSTGGHLICPFFVYRNLIPPIEKLTFNGMHFKGKVQIIDDTYCVFNAPLLITEGRVNLVFCRSTLLRGMLRKGQEIHLDCPQYTVTEGSYTGTKVGFITNPFKEITNIQDILSGYRT